VQADVGETAAQGGAEPTQAEAPVGGKGR